MECWVATHAPVLRSAIPTARLASEIFLTNLHFVFKNEVMEYWNIGVVFRNFQHSITPTLQHSTFSYGSPNRFAYAGVTGHTGIT